MLPGYPKEFEDDLISILGWEVLLPSSEILEAFA